jgi:starvation-inducible DNA-binding protein
LNRAVTKHNRTANKGDNMKKEHATHGTAQPHLASRTAELQAFGTVIKMPNGLDVDVCKRSVEELNRLLADTITLRDLYKKHHWQVAGPTFYTLHLMFDKHYEGQAELVDALAERIQILGGVSVAMAPDVASMTRVDAPPSGREAVAVQLTRLLEAHELILKAAHQAASASGDNGDHGTNDLLASRVIPVNEFQSWFVSQHLVDAAGTEGKSKSARSAA